MYTTVFITIFNHKMKIQLICLSIIAILLCHHIPDIPSDFVAYIDTKLKIFEKPYEGRERILYSLNDKLLRSDAVFDSHPFSFNLTVIENYNKSLKYIIDHELKTCQIEILSKPFMKFKVSEDAVYDGIQRSHNVTMKSWRSSKIENGFNVTQVFSFGIHSDRFYNLYTKISNGLLLENMKIISSSLANILKVIQDEIEIDQFFEYMFRIYPSEKEFIPPSYCIQNKN